MNPFLISVAGPIGAGKSSLLDFFRSKKDTTIIQENITEWDSAGDGTFKMFKGFCNNPSEFGAAFQQTVLTSIQKEIRKNICIDSINMIERSCAESVHIFGHTNNLRGIIKDQDYVALVDRYYEMEKSNIIKLVPDVIIYLISDKQ